MTMEKSFRYELVARNGQVYLNLYESLYDGKFGPYHQFIGQTDVTLPLSLDELLDRESRYVRGAIDPATQHPTESPEPLLIPSIQKTIERILSAHYDFHEPLDYTATSLGSFSIKEVDSKRVGSSYARVILSSQIQGTYPSP